MKWFEILSLQIVSIGTAMLWIMPYLLNSALTPDWVFGRWALIVGAPSILLGALAFGKHGGIAKSAPVLGYSLLVLAGCLWTPESEMGRGVLIAVAFLMVLPITALIQKHDYLKSFLICFALTSAASMIFAFLTTGSLTLRDAMGSNTTNTNGVGLQASLAALILLMFLRERKGSAKILFLSAALILIVCSVSTASRTAFLSLAGAILISLLLRSRRSAIQILLCGSVATALAVGISEWIETENPFYQGIVGRLFLDEEGTRGSLGDRTQIWSIALNAALENSTWMYGTGTGGVDAALGSLYESNGRAKGRDGIWRLNPHNTLVWGVMAHGLPGMLAMIWLWGFVIIEAIRLDRLLECWEHTTFVAFLTFSSLGGVMTQDGCWAVMGAALLAGLSTKKEYLEKSWT